MVSVLNTIDTGHEDMIHDAQMDFYGTKLATGSSDSSIKIFDLKNGSQTQVAELKGHIGPVWQISWGHPKFGQLLASCGYDRKVIVWKEVNQDWIKIYEHTCHDSSVNSVCFAPHEFGLMIACGSSDNTISIISNNGDNWEFQKICSAHVLGCNSVSWCPAIEQISSVSSDSKGTLVKRLASGGCDNLVKIWKEENDKWVEEHKLEAHSDWVREVAWAPALCNPINTIASCSQDRRVIIWTSKDFVNWSSKIINVFDDAIWSVSWSLTGGLLGVSGGDNKVSLWHENTEGQWMCLSELNKGQGHLNNAEQRAL